MDDFPQPDLGGSESIWDGGVAHPELAPAHTRYQPLDLILVVLAAAALVYLLSHTS